MAQEGLKLGVAGALLLPLILTWLPIAVQTVRHKQPFLEEGNVRMFGSIRAVAVSALEALDYVRDQGGVPFSVRRWIREGRGVLFCRTNPSRSLP